MGILFESLNKHKLSWGCGWIGCTSCEGGTAAYANTDNWGLVNTGCTGCAGVQVSGLTFLNTL